MLGLFLLAARDHQGVVNLLLDRLRRDAVLPVVRKLFFAASFGFVHRAAHRRRDRIGIEDDASFGVSRGASDRLDEACFAAQKALFVRIQDRDQTDLRQIETFAQKVDADERVEFAQAEIADDLHAIERVDVAVHVAHAHAHAVEIFGQVLRHALGQRGDQRAEALFRLHAHFAQKVVDLPLDRTDRNLGIDEPRRTDDLLGDDRRAVQFVACGRCGHADDLRHALHELLEFQRAVVPRARQTEAVFDERILSCAVAAEHPADLRQRDVAFVDEHQKILGEIVDQRIRRFAGLSAVKVARIVLDAAAEADLLHHFDVVQHARTDALGLQRTVGVEEHLFLHLHVRFDLFERLLHLLVSGRVVRRRKDRDVTAAVEDLAGQDVDFRDALDLVAEEPDAQRLVRPVDRIDVERVAVRTERAALKVHVVALILNLDEPLHDLAAVDLHALPERNGQPKVFLRIAEPVDARDRRDDDDVAAFVERAGCGVAQLVDLVVDLDRLFDVGVRRGQIRLRLIIVVIRHKKLDRGVGKQLLELGAELRGERFVVRKDERGLLHALDHLCHRIGFSASRDAQQHRHRVARLDALCKGFDRLRLIALRLVRGNDLEPVHAIRPRMRRSCRPRGADR